jgi:iron complex transport system permease protein
MTVKGGIVTLVLALACLLLAVSVGAAPIPLANVVGVLLHKLGLSTPGTWPAWHDTVICDVRLPRALVGLLVGGGLALSGTALQALFRNPLADPGVLGVSSGAALGAVVALYANLVALSALALPLLAVAGALVTALCVYALATRRGQTPKDSLLLAGIALGSLNGAAVSLLLSLSLANYEIGRRLLFWLMGGLDGRTWDHVILAAPLVLLGAAILFAHGRELDALLLGETHAASVGVDVPRLRKRLILATSLITGAAVAVSGAIAFVGLIIPHALRLALGPGHRRLLPTSVVAGGAFLLLCDLIARTAIAPEEIRLGVITAALGAPFFLFLFVTRTAEAHP